MEFITKQDYIDALNNIIKPLKDELDKSGAAPSFGSSAAWYSDISAKVESFARPLWGLVPLWRGGYGESDIKEIYRRGIINGTNPQSDKYWGETGERDQRYVEMAALAYAVLLSPEVVWDPLTDTEKQNFKNWLLQINVHEVCDSNWRFFRVLVNLALKSVGEEYSQQLINSDLARFDDFYLGNGWYMDGAQHQKDYYISMAIHFYSLVYACFENDEYAKRFRKRAELFAKDFIYWFANDGSALPYGRSLTYRFAQGAFWSACAASGVMPFDISVLKGIISRHLSDWLSAPIYDNGGFLTIGYKYNNLLMAEHYNSPGSPYWALKFFAVLALKDDNEFWKAGAAKLPELKEKHLIREADMIVCREDGEVYAYTPGTHDSLGSGQIPAKYLKFVYSTLFGFNVSYSSATLSEAAPDNMLIFNIGGVFCERRFNYSFEIDKDRLVINWSPISGIRVKTEVIPSGASHIRKHTIHSDYNCIAYDCGYAIAAGDRDKCISGAQGAMAWAENNATRCEISSDWGEGLSFGAAVNTNIINPKTVIPAVKFNINKGVTKIVSEIKAKRTAGF